MNKDFIENCKLLKSHFTKLTQAPVTVAVTNNTTNNTSHSHSKFDFDSSSAAATINRAEQLLFLDRIDLLDKIDIEDIKQHALLKYANAYTTTTDKYKNNSNCNRLCEQNNKFKWNDDIFCTSTLPYNKDKVIIFNNNDEYVTKKEEVLEKIEKLEEASKVKKEIDGTEVTVKNISPEKSKNETPTPPKTKPNIIISKQKKSPEKEKTIEITDMVVKPQEHQEQKKVEFHEVLKVLEEPIPPELPELPELKIIPQQQLNIEEVLEVKKISPSDDEETPKDELQVENIKTKYKKRDSHSSKINSFIENVEKFQKLEKSKSFVNLAESKNKKAGAAPRQNKSLISVQDKLTSYQHRFKAQKSIIEMQKEKLQEQNKIIAELKLNKIQIQAKESLQNAQKELKKISPVQKHKAKLIEETRRDENLDRINATLKLTKAPKMLQHMADRAKEREERRILINERKRLLEVEKQRIIERTMQKKLEDEQVEKQKRLAKLKEQREHLRQAELMKQELKQRYIEINETAYLHYKKKLKKRAIESFKMVIYRIRIKTEISIRFYDNNIVIKYFKIWRENVTKLNDYKTFVANRFCRRYSLIRCMRVWKVIYVEVVQRKQVAIDRHEMSLQHNMFYAWLCYMRKCKKEYNINAKKADLHYNRAVLYQYIHSWRSLPAILAIERVQLERKRKWRLRVAQILTDYNPLKSEAD